MSGEIADKLQELDIETNVPVAAELMFLAFEGRNAEIAKKAAGFIVDREAAIGSTRLIATAKRILSDDDFQGVLNDPDDFVHQARKKLRIEYKNPVLLMDVARHLVTKGHDRAALRYVRAAVGIAPQSRFVIRAAARYFLHVGDHDRAHDILKRSPVLAVDPWVQASEIAIATVRGRTSQYAKRAIRMLSGLDTMHVDFSELAGAVATVELLNGAEKKARKLFQRVLAKPNDNSLAQAEWAAQRLRLVVDQEALNTPFSFEANSNNAYRRLAMSDAIVSTKMWADDEPFSSRPLVALTYLYCLEEDFPAARIAAEHAIRNESSEATSLQLNLQFTQIQNGELEGVQDELIRLASRQDAKDHVTHILANAGALAYAIGDSLLGREFYERAIKAARVKNKPHDEALALAYFARAALIYRDENASRVVDEAVKRVTQLPNAGAIYVVQGLVSGSNKEILAGIAANRIATRKWEWDAVTNTLRALE